MNAEAIMTELRRITGACMQRRQTAIDQSRGGKKSPQGAYALGEVAALTYVLEEFAQTLKIDVWACAEELERKGRVA